MDDIYHFVNMRSESHISRKDIRQFFHTDVAKDANEEFKLAQKANRLAGISHASRKAGEMYRITGEKQYWDVLEEEGTLIEGDEDFLMEM